MLKVGGKQERTKTGLRRMEPQRPVLEARRCGAYQWRTWVSAVQAPELPNPIRARTSRLLYQKVKICHGVNKWFGFWRLEDRAERMEEAGGRGSRNTFFRGR